MQVTTDAPDRSDLKTANRPRVLVVDDEAWFVAGLNRRLRNRFDVQTALNAQDALDAVEAGPPFAVVVSDLRMPGTDGIDLLSAVRERAPATTRILLTGAADALSAADAVNRGQVFRFLGKPCEDGALLAALEDGVAEHKRHDEHERLATHLVSSFQHEFRTPLQHIIGFASFLENGGSPAGAIREYARYIRESGESLVAMTDVLLTLATLREGRQPFEMEVVKPRTLFCEVRARHRAALKKRDQDFRVSCDPLGATVSVDVRLMVLALSALVSNANKFTPEGGRIDLACRQDGAETVFEVLDTGPGVDAAQVAHVLRPFSQVDFRLARRFEGMGLGLPLAKEVAFVHGGDLSLERAADGRFAARIRVPRAARSASATPVRAISAA